MPLYLYAFLLSTLAAAPALAQSSIQIPEPSDVALFVAGVVGLIIGRRSSRRSARRMALRDDPEA